MQDKHFQQTNTPLYYRDATALASLIQAKEVSPVEVVQAHLDRISQVNPQINAVTTLLAENALASAKKAEQDVMRGQATGVFHGVPFSIKDSIHLAGVPTIAGSQLFRDNIASEDAVAVARMKASGAIPLLKSNVPEFSCWTETDNLVTGRTNNPWDVQRTPGGSSGGESAAIASGMVPMGLGSDVAISVRGPAAMTGIAALKATHGRIPYTGHFPAFLNHYWHIGPMARSVRDIDRMLKLLRGAGGQDPFAHFSASEPRLTERRTSAALRIGYLSDRGFGPVEPEVSGTVEAAAGFLRDCGHEVEAVHLASLEEHDYVSVAMTLFMGELLPDLRKIVSGKEALLHDIGRFYAGMPDPSMSDYAEARSQATRLRSAFVGYFAEYDLLLCPVVPLTAPLHQQVEYTIGGEVVPASHVMRATVPFNLTGLPALSVPYRMSPGGLPVNVQLISRWWDEETLLTAGRLLERDSQVNVNDIRL